MSESIKSIIEWHEQTFPMADLQGQLAKFDDELAEYGESECLEELADLFIVACGIARFDNVSALVAFERVCEILKLWRVNYGKPVPLQMAIDNKMAVNRNRKWAVGKGNYQHVSEGEENVE